MNKIANKYTTSAVIISFLTIIYLFFTLNIYDHHPDGISLQRFTCDIEQPWYSNGTALLPYKLITDCSFFGPQLPTFIFNFTILIALYAYIFDSNSNKKLLFLVLISTSFMIYSVFLPSKELEIAALMALVIKAKDKKLQTFAAILISMIRPAYLLLLFSRYLKTMPRILATAFLISIVVYLSQAGTFGDSLKTSYDAKYSEYNGFAKSIFDQLGYFSYPIRILWNFGGFFASVYFLTNEFAWNVLFNCINQLPLIIFFFYIAYNFKAVVSDRRGVVFLLFIIATAMFPFPQPRYLYPALPAFFWFINDIHRKSKLPKNII